MDKPLSPPQTDVEYSTMKNILEHTDRLLAVLPERPENEEILEFSRDVAAVLRAFVDGYEATHPDASAG